MALEKYNEKRKFDKTPEPKAKVARSKSGLRFVVQRHAASRLHYDFRLEMSGVLKSWAVPKGPSLNPSDKRLAMMVEDHPYEYRTFEGTIPKGNYGAGEVEIWDEGTYEALQKKSNLKDESVLLKELAAGSLKIIMHGKKLKGEFALVKIKSSADDNAWLLIKHKDEFATSSPYNAEEHVNKNSKVTAAVLEKESKKKYRTQPEKSETDKIAEQEEVSRRKNYSPYLSGAKKLDKFYKPMLASQHNAPFNSEDWIFEIKWDGYRAIAETGKDFRFYSRNGLSFSAKYPPIVDALKKQEHEMILDGEIVVYNEKGMPDFQELQHYDENNGNAIVYHIFDLIYLNGHSTESLSVLQRKELLKEALVESDFVKYCDHITADGIEFFDVIKKNNLEGMIAKKADSEYASGVRSTNWLKIKWHHTDDAVIAGYTKPKGSRSKFGALILGRYSKDGELIYAGHTGTGFDEKLLKEVYDVMQPLVTKNSPFKKIPQTNTPATWIKPELVCEIKYGELTRENIFRHPVFLGLRNDKFPTEVTIEEKADEINKKESSLDKVRADEAFIKIGKQEVKLTNQNKIYWPAEGYTKGDLIDYYNKMSRYILPYLKDRPESLNRFPNGIAGESFYHKDAGDTAPDWVAKAKMFSESNNKNIEYLICNDAASLIYLANLGCIEMNPWNSTIKKPEYPTYMIIDIDPSEKNTFEQVIEAALATKEVLDRCGADAYCKTSGSSGIHVFVPMGNKYDYEQIKNFAHIIALNVVEMLPGSTTLERSLNKRDKSKIYIDYLQNRKGQTISSVYSLRPRPGATASAPLHWDEVKTGLHPSQFDIHTLPDRVSKSGDIFKPVLGKGIDLKKCLEKF